jgi:YHS domain-containing protein/uncharacterized membrane protein YraQ (UPF0718 family)
VSGLDTIGRSLAEGWWMFYDTLWALVLGFALSGAVQAFVSKAGMQRSLGDHRPATVAKASFFGMVSSSCSYAASALAKSLFARGADFTSSMAFMFASTNLVVELGAVLWLLIGWQFALAEFVGGVIMIVLLVLVLPRVLPAAATAAAREWLDTAADEQQTNEEGGGPAKSTAGRSRTRAGWSEGAGYAVSDVTMLRKELLIGFVVAGFAAMAVPVRWWQALFVTGHGWLSSVENVIVAPVLAFVSFVCSVGNVPLGAALWKGGISFGGVVAFIFADLLALPLVLIYRKFYGTRLTVRLTLVFWVVMSAAGLATEALFRALSLTPAHHAGSIASTHVGLNYTTVLDVLAVAGFAYLYWLYRNADRFGGGAGLAKDPVCGMQVRTGDAPARARHAGHTVYFCSDRCHDRFAADLDSFIAAAETVAAETTTHGGPERGSGEPAGLEDRWAPQTIDPVCGMQVDPQHAAGNVEHGGQMFWFCSTGCRDAFTADPDRHTRARSTS